MHALRNPAHNSDDLVVVTQITPPQLDLLLDGGFYDHGVFAQATFARLDTAAVAGLIACVTPTRDGATPTRSDGVRGSAPRTAST